MSTDSESRSHTDKASRNSATYSICSLDEVPVRKSAVQIIRERSSTDLVLPGSPRRKGTMQITKLVLKDPPTSPKRTKTTPMVIRSIKTFTNSAVIAENGQILNDPNTVKPKEDHLDPDGEEGYRITPLSPKVNVGQLVEHFEAKKNERNQASTDFQTYLLESFNKENRSKNGIEVSKATAGSTSAGSANSIQHGKEKSDSSVTTTASSAQKASGSSKSVSESEHKSEEQKDARMLEMDEEVGDAKPAMAKRPIRPKTAEGRKSLPEPKKEKSYDQQKAREFIKEQQAKRKLEKKVTSIPQASEKEMIKKRLEELKRNTRVLVAKNVQNTRKRSLSASGASSQKSGSVPLKLVESRKLPLARSLRKSSSASSLKATPKSDSTKSSAGGSKASRRRSSLLKANLAEPMGIMRKPDSIALEEIMMSPLRILTPPRPPVNPPADTTPVRPIELNESIGNVQEHNVSALEQELKLDVPEVKLVPDSTIKPQEPPPAENKEFKPVPPWLKHTLLQPDPYPFIMAVRKKLEAIRNMNPPQTAHPDESAIPRKHEETVKRTKTANSQKCLDYLETLKSVPYVHKSADQSEQNISSVSLQHSESNTTSEISSIKSDFVLPLPPLSSTKFDSTQPATRETHPPEAAPISPLSVDRISNLKITANGSVLEHGINFNRGDNIPEADLIPDRISFNKRNVHDLRQSQLSLNTSEKHRNFLQKPLEKSTKELEYQKMLEAFNRSLTQVIEVNQQLYSTLNKPPESRLLPERIKIRDGETQTTPVPSVANASATSNYSEDFERSDDLKSSDPAPEDSTQSTPEKKSASHSTTTSTTSSPSSSTTTTAPQSTTSPECSPAGKTQSSEQSQLSLSDSHNTNPPMPEEYLPSFEESLRQRQQPPPPSSPPKTTEIEPKSSSTSIETQVFSDEAPTEGRNVLRETVEAESKSLESISMKLSEVSEALNDQSPPKEVEVEILKAASSSSANDSELEAIEMAKGMNDTTMGSDIMAMFNRTDMEVSVMSTTISEANLSYSSIGMYDQLIQTEKSKGDQLAAHARLKEKALLNRTKGQLAWLELQKQRYRERGMMEQISAIKKKQRAILMRLEKERADLNKLKKSTSDVSSRASTVRSPMTPKSLEMLSSNSITLRRNSTGSAKCEAGSGIHASLAALGDLSATGGAAATSDNRLHQHRRTVTTTTTTTISNSQVQLTAAVRGMELEPSGSLEDLLQRREQELQKRRQHVQTLLEWHQKLDREEQEILDMERNLLQYNQRKIAESRAADEQTMSRIRSIEKSLQTLQRIPDRPQHGSNSSDDDGGDQVQANGSKLNRLWYRLTGMKEKRYESGRSYTLTKKNLECLYEEAKQRVLEGFRKNEGMRKVLLEQSMVGLNSSGSVGRNASGISDQRNTSSEKVHTTVESGEGNSFQTTVNSVEMAQEIGDISAKTVEEEGSNTNEKIEERSSLLDVEEIISRVSDITENINGFLSSTTNIDELLLQKQLSDSVEFHTIEDEQDSGGSRTKPSSEICSATFDVATTEENRFPLSTEDNQVMIEDTSFPPIMNDDSLFNDESIVESISEPIEKPTREEIPDDTSLEEASSTGSSATTPTTAEETETEYNEILLERSLAAKTSSASEFEKRLITLNENLGELNESIERVSAIRSPEVPKSLERPNSSESESCGASPVVEDEYSTDMDFAVDDRRSPTDSADGKPFPNDFQAIKLPPKQHSEDSAEIHRAEIKIRTINANENFPHPSTVGIPSTSTVSNFSYLTPPAHGPSTSTQATVIHNRMPDIINEAEVLRRQQLQIEQEIKQLEQQVVFFREIPNKPPPPYIPPANGSPLALIFPPESRINELIETRTKELFFNEPPAETLSSDHVTNIYEKLILDMCKELFTDVRPVSPDVSFRTVKHEKRPLAFYNPPDRLNCLQNYMKQKIKRILNEDTLLQQQLQQQQLNPHHCPMPFLMFAGSSAKRKRDQVDDILAQEMFDEEARWTNFDREEIEVKERIVEEVTKMLIGEAIRDMEQVWKEKHATGKQEETATLEDGKVGELN